MNVKIGLLVLVMLCIFSLSSQALTPGRTYFNEKKNIFEYIIKQGDTLYKISRIFNIDLISLKKLNKNLNPQALQVGTKVNISINENLNYYIVQAGDTIWEISNKVNLSLNEIIAFNRIKNPDDLLPGEVLVVPQIIAGNNNIKVMKFKNLNGGVYVSGVARTFEATVNYALETKKGEVLKEGFTTAAIGAPKWGKFDFEVANIPKKAHYIVIFSISARDGSRQNEIKLKL